MSTAVVPAPRLYQPIRVMLLTLLCLPADYIPAFIFLVGRFVCLFVFTLFVTLEKNGVKILWLQYRWTLWSAALVIMAILTWFSAASTFNSLLRLDFDFFMVRRSLSHGTRHSPFLCGRHTCGCVVVVMPFVCVDHANKHHRVQPRIFYVHVLMWRASLSDVVRALFCALGTYSYFF